MRCWLPANGALGKTHLMEQLLPWAGNDKQIILRVFFGLKSTAEVDAAVYAENVPDLFRHSGEKLKGVGEATRGVSAEYRLQRRGPNQRGDNLISAYMRKEIDQSKPIIFDDLERKSMATSTRRCSGRYQLLCRAQALPRDRNRARRKARQVNLLKVQESGWTNNAIEPDTKSAFKKFRTELSNSKIAVLIGQREQVIIEVFNKVAQDHCAYCGGHVRS